MGRGQKVEEMLNLCSNVGMYNGFVTAFTFALFLCPKGRTVRIGLLICTSCMQLEKRWKAFFNHSFLIFFCTEGEEQIFHTAIMQLWAHVRAQWACWPGITPEALSIVMWFLPFPGIFVSLISGQEHNLECPSAAAKPAVMTFPTQPEVQEISQESLFL